MLLLLLLKMMIAVVMTMMMMRKWTAQSFKETATFTVYVIVIDDENRGDDGDDGDDGEADCPILHRSGRFEDALSLQVRDPRPQQIQCDLFFSRTKKIQCDILFSGPMLKCHMSTYKQNSNPRLNQL